MMETPQSGRAAGVSCGKASLVVWGCALVLLAGCNVGPKYVKPVVLTYQAPDAFVDGYKESDPNWKPANPADDALRGDWWQLFHDPALSLLEVKAAIQNQTLKVYEARFTQARAQITIDRAQQRPTIGTNAMVNGVRYSAERPYFTAPPNNLGVADIQLPVTFNYEVDLWGRIRHIVAQGKEEAQATSADRDSAQLSVQTELAMDYFELRAADAQARLLRDTVKNYQEALRITTNRFQGGVSNESDVFQAKTQLQAAIVQLNDTAVTRAQYEHAIAVLIGQPPNSFSIAETDQLAAPPGIPVALPSQLLERRPDIAAAERRAKEANEQIGIARAAYYPSLDLSLGAAVEASTLANFFNAGNLAYVIGPQIGQTFYAGGQRRGLSEQALGQFDEQAANYKQTVLTGFQQVEDNLAALRILEQEAAQQHEATMAAQGAERIFNNRYLGGLDNYLQVVTAQQTSLSNERNEIDIERRRMDASVLLIKALGGGWDTANLPKF